MATEPVRLDDLDERLRQVMAEVRAAPAALDPRMALFQLACVMGDWNRARTQLDTMAQLDPETALLVRAYASLIEAEAGRRAVLAGHERPVTIGEPPAWVALLSEALALDAKGAGAAAAGLRAEAMQAAEAVPGELDGQAFTWIMDADARLGPVLEIVVDGQYRWLPLARLRELRADPPADVKGLVWAPVRLVLANDAELHAFVPARYDGSEAHADSRVRLAGMTSWEDLPGGNQRGLGQRLLASDLGDHPFLEIRRLRLGAGDG